MAATEQQIYNLLTRTDHPVFNKDYSWPVTKDSPFNSIMNWLFARQLAAIDALEDEIALNAYPNTVTALGIDQWEETYFGFTKPDIDLSTRVALLVARYNQKITMSYPDAVATAEAITGQTPIIERRLSDSGGFIIGVAVLGVDTILADPTVPANQQTYLVVFEDQVDSDLLKKLDNELTKIQKGGSIHVIIAPVAFWILGESALGLDTVVR